MVDCENKSVETFATYKCINSQSISSLGSEAHSKSQRGHSGMQCGTCLPNPSTLLSRAGTVEPKHCNHWATCCSSYLLNLLSSQFVEVLHLTGSNCAEHEGSSQGVSFAFASSQSSGCEECYSMPRASAMDTSHDKLDHDASTPWRMSGSVKQVETHVRTSIQRFIDMFLLIEQYVYVSCCGMHVISMFAIVLLSTKKCKTKQCTSARNYQKSLPKWLW